MTLYKFLRKTGPEYLGDYWAELDALYAGGHKLLNDAAVMARLFPRNSHESEDIYRQRVARALYLPYLAEIVDYLVAGLFAEPITLTSEPAAPAFYADFHRAVDGHALTLAGLLKQQALTALLKRRAWTLVDLPPLDAGATVLTEADEESAGLLRAYAFPVPPESVLDYDADAAGQLNWALVCMRSQPRASLDAARDTITERYTWYDRTSWRRYDVTYPVNKPPKDNADIKVAAEGPHSFGRVPLIPLELPEGLWAGNKLHCIARELLNKRSSVSWSQYRHLFPILSAHLAPEIGAGDTLPSEAAQDPGRATNQTYGIGRMVVLGKDDELRYTSPDTAIYDSALRDLDGLRDEAHRVLHLMALAANNSAAALKRSGESKAQDKAAAAVVMTALGEFVREHAVAVHQVAAAGRRDPACTWQVHGCQDFDGTDVAQVVTDAVQVETLTIPSATFQRLRTFALAKKLVRGVASPEQLDAIEAELDREITDESIAAQLAPPTPVEPDGDEPTTPPRAAARSPHV